MEDFKQAYQSGTGRPDVNTVLVVDDTPTNLTVIGELLQPHYRVRVANSGERALAAAWSAPRPDLILLDVMMPVMDGYDVIRRLKADERSAHIPVIFVTAMNAEDDEQRGLDLGAVDYLVKPIRPAILLARVHTQLELKRARDWLTGQNERLEQEVRHRTREIELVKDVSLHALAAIAEKRDNETGNHLARTSEYVRTLCDELADHPRFQVALLEPMRSMIIKAAPLHDIGKVGVPDAILLKPGKLTPEEFEVMKTHAQLGADTLTDAINHVVLSTGADPEAPHIRSALLFLEVARQMAGGHHEKWDGSGYPMGLSADAIPVAARLMAVADVFDALTCKRHYKPALDISVVDTIISEGRGKHFDPDVADAYFRSRDEFILIAHELADDPPRTNLPLPVAARKGKNA